ncbi:MAG: hypothetical protein HDT09_00670 [Bacteroidales bacterium]|nr:hypothetical protein [Bacteroidales bacterium]
MTRYDSYKDTGISWIGEIPSHWEVKRGKFVSRILAGFPFDSDKFTTDEGYMPLIRIRDINSATTEMNYSGSYIEDYVIKRGDVLIGMDGDFKISQWGGGDALLNQRVCKVEDSKELLAKFAYYLLPRPLQLINDICYATTVKHLSTYDVLGTFLPVPPIEEQKVIADYLDKKCGNIDGIIATQERRIALLNELKQTIITEAVTRGINPNVPLKDSGIDWIGEIPSHWEVKRGKFVSRILAGFPFDSDKFTTDEGYMPLIRIRDINSATTEMNYSGSYIEDYVIKRGDVLIGMDGDFNISQWGGEDALLNQRVCKVEDGKELLAKFAYYLLPRPLQLINDICYATTVKHLSTYDVLGTFLPVPPIEEQKAIAEYLDKKCSKIGSALATAKRQVELFREYKQSVITEAVTGKIKVF